MTDTVNVEGEEFRRLHALYCAFDAFDRGPTLQNIHELAQAKLKCDLLYGNGEYQETRARQVEIRHLYIRRMKAGKAA